jgi:hypothetical protein
MMNRCLERISTAKHVLEFWLAMTCEWVTIYIQPEIIILGIMDVVP